MLVDGRVFPLGPKPGNPAISLLPMSMLSWQLTGTGRIVGFSIRQNLVADDGIPLVFGLHLLGIVRQLRGYGLDLMLA